MTTTMIDAVKTHMPALGVLAQDNEDLATALFSVIGQNLSPTTTTGLDKFYNPAGKLSLRNKVPATKKVQIVETDALTGEKSYPRPNGDVYFSRDWGTHTDVSVLHKARELNQYALLYGAPGTGKTAMVEAAFGDDLYTVLGSGDTEVSDLVGGYVQTPSGGFEWVDGALIRAAEEGKPFLIDEIGLIDPKVLSIVYGLMDGRREYTVTANPERGTVKAKDGFYVVGATNPNAPGVRLSEALLSRFSLHVEVTSDWALAKKVGVPAPAVTCAMNLAKKVSTGELSWSPQFRELLAFKKLSAEFGTAFAISNLLASAPELDRPVVAEVFSRVFGEEAKPAKI